MKKNKKISVIIPVYNLESYIRECLESILKQSYINWQVILVNDKSTDHTKEICEKYVLKDNRIKIIDMPINSGAAAARIEGIKNAVGDYIVFIDGDDKVHPDMFARCIEYMETSLCDVIQFDYVEVKTEETIDNNILGSIDKVKIFSSKEAIYQIYGESEVEKFNFLLWNKIYRKDVFKDLVLPNENLKINDVPFIPRIFYNSLSIGVVNDKLYFYLKRNDNQNKSTMDYVNENYVSRVYEHYKAFKNVSDYFFYIEKEMYILTYKWTLVYAISLMISKTKNKKNLLEAKHTIQKAPKETIAYLPIKKKIFCILVRCCRIL